MVHQDDLNNTVVKSTHFKSYRNKILRMSSQSAFGTPYGSQRSQKE